MKRLNNFILWICRISGNWNSTETRRKFVANSRFFQALVPVFASNYTVAVIVVEKPVEHGGNSSLKRYRRESITRGFPSKAARIADRRNCSSATWSNHLRTLSLKASIIRLAATRSRTANLSTRVDVCILLDQAIARCYALGGHYHRDSIMEVPWRLLASSSWSKGHDTVKMGII